MPVSSHDNSEVLIRYVIDTLSHTYKAETIQWLLTDDLPRRLNIQRAVLWILEAPDDWRFTQVGLDDSNTMLLNGSSINHFRHHSEQEWFRVDDTEDEWSIIFQRRGLQTIFPLRVHRRLIGVYGLGASRLAPDQPEELLPVLQPLLPMIASTIEHVRSALIITKLHTDLSLLEQLKDELIENIGHELRTPLTSLSIASQMLTRHPEMVGDLADTIEENVVRLERIIKRIMQVQNAHMMPQIEIEEIELAPLLEAIVDSYIADIDTRHLGLETVVTPGLLVRGEHYRLRQALAELVENSIRYSSSGMIRVHAKVEDGLAIISISDQGRGIPEEERHFLFSRFYRGRAVRAMASTPGIGVGLTIARNAVESIGGHIWLEASSPEGSVMCIALPGRIRKNAPDEAPFLERSVGKL